MGAACHNSKQQDNNNKPSSYVLSNLDPFPLITFEITTQNIARLDCQCLLLFTDKKLKIQKNPYLLKIGKKVAHKIQEFFDVAIKNDPLTPGKFIVFDVRIPEMGFEKICVLCLDVWGGKMKVKEPLQACLIASLREIKKKKISIISITSFNQQFGIPIDTANRCMINSIAYEKDDVKRVIILCETLEDTSEVKEIIEEKSMKKDQGQAVEQSGYY